MPSPPPPAIGWPAFVSGFRAHVGETQVEFAKRVGVRQATVSAWENGGYAPRGVMVGHLFSLAEKAGYNQPSER